MTVTLIGVAHAAAGVKGNLGATVDRLLLGNGAAIDLHRKIDLVPDFCGSRHVELLRVQIEQLQR